MSELEGKVCLVTGATDGHGRAVARCLARLGADVVVHGRNPEKCDAVQREIAAINGGKRPDALLCDLASRASIDAAASEYLASARPLDILVNNAGLVSLHRQESADGFELVLAVNFFAMFQLTMRLWPRLQASPAARVINVASDAYRVAKFDLDDLALESYSVAKSYSRSKLAVVYFTLELARRTAGQGISVNAVDPGPVASNIAANNPGFLYSLARPMIKYLFPSAERAARTAVMVATEPDVAAVSGGYFRSMKQRKKPLEFDPAFGERLWQIASDATGTQL
ncbi:MAG: SDR family oxidoreductase [Deltaproteobacteria bacterium]|nr:SDR family oxidoreductase [Deltaproteobacteria bacterium]MBW2363175.1 SDR family oxidoreductase [Deltaproteobacteria bacterium]